VAELAGVDISNGALRGTPDDNTVHGTDSNAQARIREVHAAGSQHGWRHCDPASVFSRQLDATCGASQAEFCKLQRWCKAVKFCF